MRQAAADLRDEIEVLAALLEPRGDDVFDIPTLFKDWTIGDVLGHLHMFDAAVLAALEGDSAFDAFFAPIARGMAEGRSLLECQRPWLGDLSGRALFERWMQTALQVSDRFAETDPKRRLKWAGPAMSARSSCTARQMETWAHGQEIFDALGVIRVEGDRIRNICHLGVATYGWTFANRGIEPPGPPPFVRLTSPPGAAWDWGAPQQTRVEGSAVDFARVVTQVRNVADTALVVEGAAARDWMALAQCFAGPPEDPPAPGARHRAESDAA